MSQLVKLLGGERSSAEQSLTEVFEFEQKLTQVGCEDTFRRCCSVIY